MKHTLERREYEGNEAVENHRHEELYKLMLYMLKNDPLKSS